MTSQNHILVIYHGENSFNPSLSRKNFAATQATVLSFLIQHHCPSKRKNYLSFTVITSLNNFMVLSLLCIPKCCTQILHILKNLAFKPPLI